MSQEDCFAHHDYKKCFLLYLRYHIIILGDLKELLRNLDATCFNYQHVDCLYTLLKYRLSGKIAIKNGQFFNNVQRAVHFNHQNKAVER